MHMKTAEMVTAAINLAALLFVGAQVVLARRALQANREAQDREWARLRKQATLEIAFTTREYRESLKSALPRNDRNPKEVAAFLNEADGDHKKLSPVRQYLNHLTGIAVGIKEGTFDLDTLSMLEGSRIIGTVESYRPFIEHMRLELRNPSTYEDVEELAEMLRVQRNGKL